MFQAWTGFEPMPSAVLNQLSYQAKWELVILWVRNKTVDDEYIEWTAGEIYNPWKTIVVSHGTQLS